MRNFLPFLTLISLIGLVAIATYNLNKKQEIATIENGSAPDIHFVKTKINLPNFSLPDLFDEEKVFSKKNLTNKYSLLNFFASWCTTCQAEHEILLRLKSEKIIDIYGIAWRDFDDKTKSYLAKNGNPYKETAVDSRGLFTKIAGIQAIPETWIVNQDGEIVMRFRGNLQDFSIGEIKEFLNQN